MRRGSLIALLREVRQCRICEDLPLGPRPVLQAGRSARILIASQAPGRRAHASGLPFDDASGDRLRDWLGVDRDTFYDPALFAIVPMGFCFPGTGRGGDLPPRPECAPAWRHAVLEKLPDLALTLAIGQYAIAWHLPEQRKVALTETVRQWRSHWPALLPMPHPSPRNNRWLKQNPFFEAEILPVLRARVAQLIAPGS
ncbi:MAG TPA: uracil-DNA glycosylase family protein [Spongiibacteraceae bacterium]|jgi:uracil-DNA glycosylase|nr:uracil-DNA glycosylase family protein [Spongiibacteraceae bacterium]HUH37518.1 uracil-DNA glycosylase family protein [Spongiibacteraceae bacterium]